MTKTEYIITAQMKKNLDGDDNADWIVCSTYESAKSWTRWFSDRYKFVYVRECGEPLTIGRS